MIYLDNAATSFPKAPGVSAAMAAFLDQSAGNPGRAGHRLAGGRRSVCSTTFVSNLRASSMARIINA